ncbi:methicillin resistance protein, partial [Candidatus Falkowbacteria bacterium CG_4_9_14_3_um_filter_36_9]
MQSWQWGEFHKNVSGNVWRLGIIEEEKLTAAATIIEKS